MHHVLPDNLGNPPLDMDDIVGDLDSGCGEDSRGGSPGAGPSDPLRPATQDSSAVTTTRITAPATARVSLKKRAESFSAGSLLARFHSSRKSDSDIQGERKKDTSSCSGNGGGGVGPRREISDSDTSASLPDCLHQQDVPDPTEREDSSKNPRVGSEDLNGNDEVEVTEENSPFIDVRNGNGLVDNWFLTWPGRQKSLKSFMKKKKNVDEKKCEENKLIKSKENIVPTSEDVCDHSESDKDIDKVTNMETKEKSTAGQVSLDALLESLPLVYDPSTKQLCIGRENSFFNGPRRPPPIRSQSLPSDDLDNEKIGYEHDVDLQIENESQKELLLHQTEPSSPSYLESIQEQDENSEGARLMRASPTSGTRVARHFESPRNSLPRVSTTTSLSMTDASSFSSLSSSNTELSLYSASDSAVCLGSHLSDTSSLHSFTDDTKLKRKGITEFLSRTVFSWRHKEGSTSSLESSSSLASPSSIQGTSSSSPGWKLFSRGSSRSSASPDLQRAAVSPQGDLGTTGLILEGRPVSLPAKTAEEDLKHKQEYQAMVSLAKKKEMREAKERQRAATNQKRHEEQLASAVNTWNNQILSKWDTMRNNKKCRELWWLGLPSCVRGKVWRMAIGNDLNINKQLYNIMVQRSIEKLKEVNCGSSEDHCSSLSEATASQPENHESTIELIRLDVSRTFPQLCIFQKGGPYHDPLHHILGAYACYRPDVGYMQGMSYLAATLLLNMDESDAFTCFANLLNRTTHQAFFTVNQHQMSAYYSTYEELLTANLPGVAKHLQELCVTPDMYILDWYLTVFARSVPLDAAARIWDVYLRDGEEFLFRAAIGIIKLYSGVLTSQECTTTAAQFLTRLPDNMCTEALFTAIQGVRMTATKRTFTQILQHHLNSPNYTT